MSKEAAPALKTESVNRKYRGVDQWPVDKTMGALLADQISCLQAIGPAIPIMSKAVEEAALRLEANENARIVYGGAGTSIRLGVLDGTELTPTYGWSKLRMAFVIAGGNRALQNAVENAEDNHRTAINRVAQLKLTANDVFIGVAASGMTPFTVAACEAARAAGAMTIGIASNTNSKLLAASDYPIFIDSGREPVGGSTRMNAGTAQKATLNMLSTAIMIQMGRVYDGYMVNMIPTNKKLRIRAEAIVSEISGCTQHEAKHALVRAKASYGGITENNIKLAVLLAKGAGLKEAKESLEATHYHLRPALAALTP
ncbi:MAG: N-acetylmuramic acid 6-phosphate etherase [Micavibrio sp.]|nr:N-acetylmuramic acid 6-phosphate etherase [Micavibrio sp.]